MSLPQTETKTLSSTRSPTRSGRHDRFLVTTHENPDGDALGSIVAMKLALEQLGKDSCPLSVRDHPAAAASTPS